MFALRIPFSAITGAVLAAAVFLGLFHLVSVPFDVQVARESHDIVFTPQRRDSPIETKRDPKLDRPAPPVIPVVPERGSGDVGPPTIVVEPPTTRIVPPERKGLSIGSDRDVIPLVRVAPEYPPSAIARGTEGWVQVRFTITPTGAVRDPVVVASEPARVFDEAALKAVARWRYNPRIEGGEAVERVGVQTVIRFDLD